MCANKVVAGGRLRMRLLHIRRENTRQITSAQYFEQL